MTGAEHSWSRERTEGKKGASGNSWGKEGKRDRKGNQLCSAEGQGKPGSDCSKTQWNRKCQGSTVMRTMAATVRRLRVTCLNNACFLGYFIYAKAGEWMRAGDSDALTAWGSYTGPGADGLCWVEWD